MTIDAGEITEAQLAIDLARVAAMKDEPKRPYKKLAPGHDWRDPQDIEDVRFVIDRLKHLKVQVQNAEDALTNTKFDLFKELEEYGTAGFPMAVLEVGAQMDPKAIRRAIRVLLPRIISDRLAAASQVEVLQKLQDRE